MRRSFHPARGVALLFLLGCALAAGCGPQRPGGMPTPPGGPPPTEDRETQPEKDRGQDARSDTGNGKKYALLVGCTYYEILPENLQLWGPGNDIPLMARLLTEEFGFDRTNVKQLVGWPKDPKGRPTYTNIAAGMEDLIRKADADTQVVIQFSGHGTQFPIPKSQTDPNDPRNPEPDGFDEVFLPSDVKGWTEDSHENALIDDQIGQWLDQLRDKGANVWIIFDCCHSGSMTRDTNQVERQRVVKPQSLHVTDAAIAEARAKAEKAAERNRGSTQETSPLALKPKPGGKGSLVAFYATQSFEEAPELPRPEGASQVPENYYGMLTYTLAEALRQRQSPITYRDLEQIIASRYRAERKSRPPTPFAEGDLDREVLGVTVWPKPTDLLLGRDNDKLQVAAGELHGLTPDSILEVHPPAGDAHKETEVLGYVKVTHLTPLTADVRPCAYTRDQKETPEVGAGKLPDRARCRVVEQAFGDMRVKLAVASDQQANPLKAALSLLDQRVAALVDTSVDEAKADWVLRTADVEKTRKAVLWQGEGRKLLDSQREREDAETARVAGQPVPRLAFGGYSADDPKQLAADLNRDLQKIYKWQNVWRIAGTLGDSGARGNDYGLKLEVIKLEGDKEAGPLRENVVDPGQRVEIRLKNEGNDDLFVTLLYLDANFGIQTVFSEAIERKQAATEKGTITRDAVGAEGLVVFAVPLSAGNKTKPDFSFLKQAPLGRVDDKIKGTPPRTPFGRLMAAAAFGDTTARGFERDVATNPAILARSWVTRPAPARPGKP
jgi:hypothetical protein